MLYASADDFRTSGVLIILKRASEANSVPFPGATFLKSNQIKSSFSCRTLIHAGWLLELNSGEIAGNFTESVTLFLFFFFLYSLFSIGFASPVFATFLLIVIKGRIKLA